jgi:hypothetical protein
MMMIAGWVRIGHHSTQPNGHRQRRDDADSAEDRLRSGDISVYEQWMTEELLGIDENFGG